MSQNQNPNLYRPLLANIPKNISLSSNVIPTSLQTNISTNYTKDGENKMIPLSWNLIQKATSYALFCVDLHKIAKTEDSNGKTIPWVHLYIPYIQTEKNLDFRRKSGIIGTNSFGNQGYDGPSPPPGSGRHKYVFYLLALRDMDKDTLQSEESRCRDLQSFIQNVVGNRDKILGYGELSFTYQR